MMKIAFLVSYVWLVLTGCGAEIKPNRNMDPLPDLALDIDAGKNFQGDMVQVKFSVMNAGNRLSGTLVVNLSCDNVYNPNSPGDWTMNNVSLTESSGQYTVEIVGSTTCSITMVSYFDGTNTFTPSDLGSPLVMAIAANGDITESLSPIEYTNGATPTPLLEWFIVAPNGPYNAIFYASQNSVAANVNTPVPLDPETVTITVNQLPAPDLIELSLYSSDLNTDTTTYTLVADVTSYTSCVYTNYPPFDGFDSSSWADVNTAYENATTPCPDFSGDDGTNGNWTALWPTNYLIIWANTVDNLSSYTTAVVGATAL